MKLVFPHGEHKDVELEDDLYRIGSAETADICLPTTGVAEEHAVIRKDGPDYVLEIDNPAHLASVNGKLVHEKKTLHEGDLLIISQVHCRLQPSADESPSDPAQTVVRMALPKYVIRGVSGPYFGKTYPLRGTTVLGRHADCDIRLNNEGISRRHAEIVVTGDGLLVRDIGSSNGTFVNGEKIEEKTLKVGDEVRFDALRFLVQNPALPEQPKHAATQPASKQQAATTAQPAPATGGSASGAGKWVFTLVVLAAAAAAAAWYLGYLKI
jgi:pSer/pThr/pTyr-binding forkhead associated (FHA) protein